VGKASSAKKASRIAKSSGGRKVRSQQGLVFPVALVVVLTLGLALLIYGRATSHQDLGAPALNTNTQPGDHWHTAFQVNICGEWLTAEPQFEKPADNPNQLANVGIHTHGDDLIHTHPFIADGGEKMQFNVIFPRPVPHRVWMQFERQGVVNTSSFYVDVTAL